MSEIQPTLFSEQTPVRMEDFNVISPLVQAYELKPNQHYFILADGKDFSYEHAHSLLKDLREEHPELTICIVASTQAKKLKVATKRGENDD